MEPALSVFRRAAGGRRSKMARRKAPAPPAGDLETAAEFRPRTLSADPFSPFNMARYHAIEIARDRTETMSAEAKDGALKYIENVLESWKLSQADEEGMIEVQPAAGLLGTFYGEGSGMTLADLAHPGPKRIAADKLKPWSCAGPLVSSPADLWVKLWADKFEPVLAFEGKVPLDLAMALLVERDGETMPVTSIASALRYVWISTWVSLRAYRQETQELSAIVGRRNELRRKQLDALKLGRAITAKNKTERARTLLSALRTMAVDLFVADISQNNDQVASRLRQFKEFAHLSHRGICDRIKGAQSEARQLLARRPPK